MTNKCPLLCNRSSYRRSVLFPSIEWPGDILGGFRFSEVNKFKEQEGVNHEYVYTVGTVLRMTDGEPVENDLVLREVTLGQRNYRNHIEANIQNRTPVIIRSLEVEVNVFQKGKNETAYHRVQTEIRMTPNSNFNFGIPTGDIPLQPGDYLLEMSAVADGKEYFFEKEFIIEPGEARKLNASDVNIEPSNFNVWLITIILLTVFLIVSIFIVKKKSNNKG